MSRSSLFAARRVRRSMPFVCLLTALGSACSPQETNAEPDQGVSTQAAVMWAAPSAGGTVRSVDREVVTGDVAHYTVTLRVGAGPNAQLVIHRIVRERKPFRPRNTDRAVMLLHGDFATFSSNFAPSLVGAAPSADEDLAVYLAGRDIDVWGLDRRWTRAPAEGPDLSDFGGMGFSQAITDTARSLRFARAIRALGGSGGGHMLLGGFSRGGHIAYAYAAEEAKWPAEDRLIDGLITIDVYAAIAPSDEESRTGACARRDEERAALSMGLTDSDNTFFSLAGGLALEAPDEPSPLFEGYTNRGAMLALTGQTYYFFAPTPLYHLAGGVVSEDMVTALRYSPEPTVFGWFAAAAPHQAMAEIADGDALWCGEGALPPGSDLAGITVPVFYLGAAGGFGDHGLYTLSLLGSEDVTTHVVRELSPEEEAEDYGHGDLLYGSDAESLAWEPLAEWILGL